MAARGGGASPPSSPAGAAVLPKAAKGVRWSAEAKEQYAAFNAKRAGGAGYHTPPDQYLRDPHSAPASRAPQQLRPDVLIVGAGFSGLMLTGKLHAAGITDICVAERAGDVGGAWYWNRYPGVACDVESYAYLPLLEEMNYVPTMKYASGFEIFSYCQKMAKHFGVYERGLFHTTVTATHWDEEQARWIAKTDRGDTISARFVIMASGILTQPRVPSVKGMDGFRGRSFHTSRWDHTCDLKGKTVGIIGTGATAVQVVPELAQVAGRLLVFQRTPSSIDVRNQHPTDPADADAWSSTPGWARKRRARFDKMMSWRDAYSGDPIQDSDEAYAAKYERVQKLQETMPREKINEMVLNHSFKLMERVRARVDSEVHDPATAASLKPYYHYGCKRPCFHDEYLAAFNRPNVALVDTSKDGGVRRIAPEGPVVGGKVWDCDVLIYATGFEYLATGPFNRLRGRGGASLAELWREGTRTFLGLHVRGFPNMFFIVGPQGLGWSFNFTSIIEAHVDYIVWALTTMRKQGAATIDVTAEAVAEYSAHCAEVDTRSMPQRDCISYYNREGAARPGDLTYYGTRAEWFRRKGRAQGSLSGAGSPYVFGAPPPPRGKL